MIKKKTLTEELSEYKGCHLTTVEKILIQHIESLEAKVEKLRGVCCSLSNYEWKIESLKDENWDEL